MRQIAAFSLTAIVAAGCSGQPRPPFSNQIRLELYDVQDLVACGAMDLGPTWGDSPGEKLSDGAVGRHQFAERVRSAIAPQQWGKDDWTLTCQNGVLIARAPAFAHSAVESLLATERAKAIDNKPIREK
jgi:hypothetical protein